jgi:hypothetical protein
MFFSARPTGTDPNAVSIPQVNESEAVWPGPSFSRSTASGPPDETYTDEYYINVNGYQLYHNVDGVWTGPHAFTYSPNIPGPGDTGGPSYWIVGSGGAITGGIYGPRELSGFQSPNDGDVIAWSASAGTWVAVPLSSLLGGD